MEGLNVENLAYSQNISDIINFLEDRYNEKIENFPFIPYETNIKFKGNNFLAIVYRLPLGTYELTHYSIKG
jgi:hypothetical protein